MTTPLIIYCYDAYCGWCYGFSSVVKKLEYEYRSKLDFEVLSGGMILPAAPRHIGVTAAYIQEWYPKVEQLTGVSFGEDYLWHIRNPSLSDWFPDSKKPAIALCVFKEFHPSLSVQFACDLQYALHYEGRDLCDNEAYRHLLEKYHIPAAAFYEKLDSNEYKERAYEEFELCRQLKVKGFPALFLQVSENKIYALANGYTEYRVIQQRLEVLLAAQITNNNQ
ncbi:MAG: DsbA family protein [Chitinophagaceae bacterium]|nr:DsbA family protein [Chitinophagaceae bacterium]